MDIQTITPLNFSCRTIHAQLKPKFSFRTLFNKFGSESDLFVRTSFNINRDLNKVKLKKKINEGKEAEVYKTNFDGYVVRLTRGIEFKPKN